MDDVGRWTLDHDDDHHHHRGRTPQHHTFFYYTHMVARCTNRADHAPGSARGSFDVDRGRQRSCLHSDIDRLPLLEWQLYEYTME